MVGLDALAELGIVIVLVSAETGSSLIPRKRGPIVEK